jgi:hypothetical protein
MSSHPWRRNQTEEILRVADEMVGDPWGDQNVVCRRGNESRRRLPWIMDDEDLVNMGSGSAGRFPVGMSDLTFGTENSSVR